MQDALKEFIRREGWTFVIACGLVYAVFLIQLVGVSLTDDDLRPIISPAPRAWRFVGEVGFDLSTLAPFLSLAAVYIVRTPVAYETVPAKRRVVWTLALIALVLSFAEFWWSSEWPSHLAPRLPRLMLLSSSHLAETSAVAIPPSFI